MSMGIYAFLRIYFFGFWLSDFAQFRTRSTPSSACSRPDLPSAACLVLSADRCSVSSVRVCVSCLAWSALLPVMCAVRFGVLGAGAPPAGYTAAALPRPVSLSTTEKIKKAQKNHPTPIANLKNFPQKQKDPYKGSVFCAILSLQALKGRNL